MPKAAGGFFYDIFKGFAKLVSEPSCLQRSGKKQAYGILSGETRVVVADNEPGQWMPKGYVACRQWVTTSLMKIRNRQGTD